MKKHIAFTLISLLAAAAFSQGILTASSFFKSVSENYATIKDYEADVDIKASKTSMSGHLSYKSPNLLRIDFTSPEEQVICFNGDLLTIYLPGSAAILNQTTRCRGAIILRPTKLVRMPFLLTRAAKKWS